MSKRAQLPDGRVLEFPDETPDDVIDRAARAEIANPRNDSRVKGLVGGTIKPIDNLVKAAQSIPGFDAIDRFGQRLGMPSARDAVANNTAMRANNSRTGWQAAGNIVGALPASRIPGGIFAQGAASGALLTDKNDIGGVLQDAAFGGITSKIGGDILNGIGGIVAPRLSGDVKRLAEAGVRNMTPGQLMAGQKGFVPRLVNKTEEALTSSWGLGDLINHARDAAQGSYESALGNRVLGNIGQRLPKGMQGADDIVSHAKSKVDEAYNALVPKLKMTFDQQFGDDLIAAKQMVTTLPDTIQKQFEGIVRNAFVNRAQGSGIAGKPLKEAEAYLSKQMRAYAPKGGDHGILAEAIGGVRQALRSGIERSNPQFAGELQLLNKAWAQLRPLRKSLADSGEDALSPSRVFQATKPFDDKLVRAGKRVLTNKTPDSGTARRAATTLATGAVPYLAGGPTAALAVPAAIALAYAPKSIKAMNKFATAQRGKAANAVADTSRWIGSHTGGFLPGLLSYLTGK